jgi:hypothetical protein
LGCGIGVYVKGGFERVGPEAGGDECHLVQPMAD